MLRVGLTALRFQVAGQAHQRWQAKCSVLQHTSATATSAKDAYLVSLTGDAKDAGYVVLRRVRALVSPSASADNPCDHRAQSRETSC